MTTARERELRKQNRILVRQEALAERDLAAVIKRMAGAVASRLTYGDEQASLQIVEEFRPEIAKVLERRMGQTALIFGGRTLERLKPFMGKSYYGRQPIGGGPVRGRDEVDIEHKFTRELFEGAVLQWIKGHALERAKSITATLKGAVRQVLADSFADGTGEAGTARLIRERIGKTISQTNAARIARTEMHTAATQGADHAARSTGLEIVKEWASAEDARTRASHAAADGQEVKLDEPFSVGGELLMVPGDPRGSAKNVVNCRCAVLHHPVIGGVAIR